VSCQPTHGGYGNLKQKNKRENGIVVIHCLVCGQIYETRLLLNFREGGGAAALATETPLLVAA
jgi:hypothetical protein